MNIVMIEGRLSSEPRYRDLPSGSVLHAYEVSTSDGDVTRSVPVVWIDPVRPPKLGEGDQVVVVGMVRRRFFRAGGAVASRTEVEAEVVAKVGSARARRVRVAALGSITASASDEPSAGGD
jgi:single-strand DNA-binding protein